VRVRLKTVENFLIRLIFSQLSSKIQSPFKPAKFVAEIQYCLQKPCLLAFSVAFKLSKTSEISFEVSQSVMKNFIKQQSLRHSVLMSAF
jgi:hypothetical protein